MHLTIISVLNERHFAKEVSQLAKHIRDEKLIHCYINGLVFNVGFASGVTTFDFSNMENFKGIKNYASITLKILRQKCPAAKILSSSIE
jgi:hypothetical protein